MVFSCSTLLSLCIIHSLYRAVCSTGGVYGGVTERGLEEDRGCGFYGFCAQWRAGDVTGNRVV